MSLKVWLLALTLFLIMAISSTVSGTNQPSIGDAAYGLGTYYLKQETPVTGIVPFGMIKAAYKNPNPKFFRWYDPFYDDLGWGLAKDSAAFGSALPGAKIPFTLAGGYLTLLQFQNDAIIQWENEHGVTDFWLSILPNEPLDSSSGSLSSSSKVKWQETSLTDASKSNAQETVSSKSPPDDTKFPIGAKVEVTDSLNVRNAPGTSSGTIISTKAAGSKATVLSGPYYADDFTWWEMQYNDGTKGYSQDKRLELAQTNTVDQKPVITSSIDTSKNTQETAQQANQAETQVMSFGAVDTSFGTRGASSDVQSQKFGSGSERDLGGINFTSIKLNCISVSTDSSGGVNFDLILKAQKAEGTSPGINIQNATRIGATAFMDGIAVPDYKFWVNLNPWEADRIIDEQLGQSEVGRIMLEADLQMKKDLSNYGNPCANETGKALWNLLDKKREFLVQQCVNKFPGEIKDIDNVWFLPLTRYWIVPDNVYVYTNGTQIYIINATLTIKSDPVTNHSSFRVDNQEIGTLSKGCLEELNRSAKEYGEYQKDLDDRMILPYVVADVNHGEKYEDLRNVYVALALAQWYKSSIISHRDIFRANLDLSNSTALKSMKPWSTNEIWDKYVYSFKNGEYKCWENETTKNTTVNLTKSRFRSSGGIDFGNIRANMVEIDKMPLEVQDQIKKAIIDGFIDEGKDVFFGNRLHVDLRQDTHVSTLF